MIRPAFGRTDPWLLLAVLLLVPLGVLMVHSSTANASGDLRLSGAALRQLAIATAGLAAMLVLSRIDYRSFERLGLLAYLAMLGMLAAVLILGLDEYGARRWLGIGGMTLQPSELAKPTLVLALAAYMAGRNADRSLTALGGLGLLAPPVALVVAQPDLGTAIVLAVAALGMVVAWGVRWRLLGACFASVTAMLPLAYALAVPAYQRERIAVFLDPARDPLGSGFNLQQAEVAIRSGGLTGRGFFEHSASALEGVGARSSDFMFAQVGQELGLLGGLLLLALLALLVWRGLVAARHAPDTFGRLLAVGLTLVVFTQAVVHTAVNLRLFPTTGIPLPFISQGGSSLLMMCLVVGLLQSIAAQRSPSARELWSAQRWR